MDKPLEWWLEMFEWVYRHPFDIDPEFYKVPPTDNEIIENIRKCFDRDGYNGLYEPKPIEDMALIELFYEYKRRFGRPYPAFLQYEEEYIEDLRRCLRENDPYDPRFNEPYIMF